MLTLSKDNTNDANDSTYSNRLHFKTQTWESNLKTYSVVPHVFLLHYFYSWNSATKKNMHSAINDV